MKLKRFVALPAALVLSSALLGACQEGQQPGGGTSPGESPSPEEGTGGTNGGMTESPGGSMEESPGGGMTESPGGSMEESPGG